MIRLHHCAETRSMRTLWQLNEIGCEFEIQHYEFGKALRSDEFKAINPVSRVPALEIDGEVLIETGAIAEILCEKFPEAGLGRPIGDPERNMFLQLIHFAETISQHCEICRIKRLSRPGYVLLELIELENQSGWKMFH